MKHFLSLFSSRGHYAVALIIVYLVIGMGTQACAATEAKQTANEVKKIEKEALLPGDIKVVKPHEELDEHLKALSGYWYGTWIGILPCQLVVETIDAKEAVVVFCWGDHPGGDYLGNWCRFKAKVSLPGKIEFNFLDDSTYFLDDSTFTFELDPAKDVLKGKQFSTSQTYESTMYRNKTPDTTIRRPAATWKWPRAEAAQMGLDPERLQELVTLIREGEKFPQLESLLIVRGGKLVIEEYFRGWQPQMLHTLQSVSKSFTSALVGIAIGQGYFKGTDEKMLSFFPGIEPENQDERKKAIKVQDLLTMRTGTDYHERGEDSPHFKLNSLAKGWDRFYLNRKMVNQPGTHFNYDSGGVVLLSAMLKNRTGMHADKYAEKYLFNALDIKEAFWFKNSEGHPHTGGGLNLRPLDMAKFGQLYLQKGKWEGKQVVPEEWVKVSLKKHVTLIERKEGITGYGYLWWVLAPDPQGAGKENIYLAKGFLGQYIFIIPEYDMVVVITGDAEKREDRNKPLKFLYSHILPAVTVNRAREK